MICEQILFVIGLLVAAICHQLQFYMLIHFFALIKHYFLKNIYMFIFDV